MASKYNLSVDAGATYLVEFEYTNADGSLFDLTGCTAKMQIRDMPTSPFYVIQIIPTLIVSTAIITASLSATQTSSLTNSAYVYAIEITQPTGQVIRLVEGKVIVSLEIVR